MRAEPLAKLIIGMLAAALRLLALTLVMLVSALAVLPVQAWLAKRAPAKAAKVAARFGRVILWLCRVEVRVVGQLRSAGCLAASNHVSWLDIPALATVHPFCFLAKREVASWPLVSRIAAVQGTVFVDRERRRTLIGVNRTLAARLVAGRAVMLFPEGTTTADAEPRQFKTPHFEAAVAAALRAPRRITVQPVAISYSSPLAPWIGEDNLLEHVWRLLRGRRMLCTISIGPPAPVPAGASRKEIGRVALLAVRRLLAPAAGPESASDAIAFPAFPEGGKDAA